MRILTVLSTVAATGLLIAGCGGDDDVSEEDFVAEVTAICDDAADEVAGLGDDLTNLSSQEEAEAYVVDELIPLFNELQGSLEEVDAPEDLSDDYDELLALAAEQTELVADDPGALFDPESDVAQQSQEISAQADELSGSLGLPSNCGEPGGGASGATGETGE